jgi:hypothetical protein
MMKKRPTTMLVIHDTDRRSAGARPPKEIAR